MVVVAAVGARFLRRRIVPAYSRRRADSLADAGTVVDEAGRDSFPASDPPGWTLGEDPKD
jgi:hypothetical protein